MMKYSFAPNPDCRYRFDYEKIAADLNAAAERDPAEEHSIIRAMVLADLFFLIYFVLKITKVNQPFVVARVYEVQDEPHGTLDLWAREHFKSTILTYALIVWEVLRNPEERICIISHTRSIAKAFLQRLKVTFENNELLKAAFPDVLYMEPEKESPKWALDHGLILKRQGNFLEATLEAWGIVDGMPAGKHFTGRVYDDLVTEVSVATPEQMAKTLYAYELSHNIGADGGWFRVIGTIYHFADLYMGIIKEQSLKVRKYPAVVDGEPVLLSHSALAEKRKHMGAYVWACQMMLDPVADDNQAFRKEWLKFTNAVTQRINTYIIVDPATKKKRNSDFTTIWVIGVDSRRKKYIVDGVHDRLGLKERWVKLRDLVIRWNPLGVGYEQYGMQSDIEYIEERQETEGVFFPVTPLGGFIKKEERILRLVPHFEDGTIILPRTLFYQRIDGSKKDLMQELIHEEYLTFPYSAHDDMMDCLARILDDNMNVQYPRENAIAKFFRPQAHLLDEEIESYEESWMTI